MLANKCSHLEVFKSQIYMITNMLSCDFLDSILICKILELAVRDIAFMHIN